MQNLKTKVALIVSLVLLPSTALAQTLPPPPCKDFQCIVNIINKGAGWLFSILIALSVVFLIYAAYLYLDARGDETKVSQAKSVIIYAIWAIAIALVAAGIPSIIANFFGVQL